MGTHRGSAGRRCARAVLRAAGGTLGPGPLALCVLPAAAALGACRVARGTADVGDPAGYRRHHSPFGAVVRAIGDETRAVMSGIAWVFRDRFRDPAWRSRIEISGADRLRRELDAGRPVVLATAHTEAMMLLGRMLGAAGFQCGILVQDASQHSRRFGAERTDLAPRLIDLSDLRAAGAFLERPRILIVGIDAWRGKHVRAPSPRHAAALSVATGAARLARSHGAACMTGVVIQRGLWRYHVSLGLPVHPSLHPDAATIQLGVDLLSVAWAHRGSWTGVLRAAVQPLADPRPTTPESAHPSGAQTCPTPA